MRLLTLRLDSLDLNGSLLANGLLMQDFLTAPFPYMSLPSAKDQFKLDSLLPIKKRISLNKDAPVYQRDL